MQDSQDKKVRMNYREGTKEIPPEVWMVVCVCCEFWVYVRCLCDESQLEVT